MREVWDVMPRIVVSWCRRFGGNSCSIMDLEEFLTSKIKIGFYPEYGISKHLRNIVACLPDYTLSCHVRQKP